MDCTVIGDILFDVIISGDYSKLNLVLGGATYSNQILMEYGGVGNVAVGLSRLGGKVHLIGKAGKDFLGDSYLNNLKTKGILANVCFTEKRPTGFCLTFINKFGERSFLVSRGANDFLSPDEVEMFSQEIIKSSFLFISGYSILRSPQKEAVFKAVEIAKSENIKIIFDPGSHNLIGQNRDVFDSLLKISDILVLNLDEATAYTNCNTVADSLEKLSQYSSLIALKLGHEGCILATSNKKIKCPAYGVNCIDSTGAGDAFASALIFGLAREIPLEIIADLANKYASLLIQRPGAQSSIDFDNLKDKFSFL